MSQSFMFFRPARLPLLPEDLSEETVRPLPGVAEVRSCLERHFAAIAWEDERHGSVDADGRWIELTLNDDAALPVLAMRCSLRADYADVVQSLCDAFGWLAFDGTPALFQPHRPPARL